MAATLVAFLVAYYFRIFIDARPYFFEIGVVGFLGPMMMLLPIWLVIFLVCGLYREEIYLSRLKESGRIFVAAMLGVMSLISYNYFLGDDIFPVRTIAVYALLFCFLALVVERNVLRGVRRMVLARGIGVMRVVVVGNHFNTGAVVGAIGNDLRSGYNVVGVVANKKYLRGAGEVRRFEDLDGAVRRARADMIIQTDSDGMEKVYEVAVKRHLGYMVVPSADVLLSQRTSLGLLGDMPVFEVKATTLVGYGRVVKRGMDLVVGGVGLICAVPVMLVVAGIIRVVDGRGGVFFRQVRLSRFGKKVKIYKFRTMRSEYSGMSPEEAFAKMGRPELTHEYRAGGDRLADDPRVSRLGRFLRKSSLDELPQLINVVRGDISLVGPRALVPEELRDYPDKELILAVKSGMTGLAQISGRREIGFRERRVLDVYYIQNWTIMMDVQILIKTVWRVLMGRGAG
jgi:exopolysaccharide biosynthesis polyprenyl glycosylphosphotransferase